MKSVTIGLNEQRQSPSYGYSLVTWHMVIQQLIFRRNESIEDDQLFTHKKRIKWNVCLVSKSLTTNL